MATVTAAEGVVYLTACGINQITPEPEILSDMDYAAVYKLAKWHGLAALCWYALEGNSGLVPEELRSKWENTLYASMRKNALMDAERNKFFTFCEREGIRHMPLKGIILQKFYPASGTREMADNDILFDSSRDMDVHDYFCSDGWSVESFRLSNHDIYHKLPFINFELHRNLFSEQANQSWYRYYEQPFKNAYPEEEGMSEYAFNDEDFYAYVMVHAYKHYTRGGTGLRNLVDCYLCRHNLSLDQSSLNRILEELGIVEYEREAAELSEMLFADPAKVLFIMRNMEDNFRESLDYYLNSGTYGTLDHHIANDMRNIAPDEECFSIGTRMKYIWKSIFPGKEHMQLWCRMCAPFLARHEGLLWISPFYRLIYRSVTSGRTLKHRLRIIWKR